jgi:CRISPR-associated endonuclease/helicase Cas3
MMTCRRCRIAAAGQCGRGDADRHWAEQQTGHAECLDTSEKPDENQQSVQARAVGDDCIHLSTLMCAAHRREILRAIQGPDQRCIVVATQLVEAGVDLDFPVVYRALAGVDSLAQAAGRCNREGRLPGPGEFHVFVAPTRPPRGTLENGAKVMSGYLLDGAIDLFAPDLPARYFAELKDLAGITSEITGLERARNFPEVDRRFRMIDNEGTPVIAPYGDWRSKVAAARAVPCIGTFRGLQPYTVSLDDRFFQDLQARGCLEPLLPGSEACWVVMPRFAEVYSQRFGFGGGDMPFLEG